MLFFIMQRRVYKSVVGKGIRIQGIAVETGDAGAFSRYYENSGKKYCVHGT